MEREDRDYRNCEKKQRGESVIGTTKVYFVWDG
jgi:hypothetical protein